MKSSENTVDEVVEAVQTENAEPAAIAETAENVAENAAESSEKENSGENLADEKEKEENKVVHADNGEKFTGNYEAMLTTVDNPFDPFEKFDDWLQFDEEKGYHSCAYLGRIAEVSDEMSDEEFHKEIERAIDEIIQYDFLNIYKKIRRPAEVSVISAETVEFDD